jgi:hypothetical protein
VLLEGSLPPAVHRVVKDEEYRGEIKIALTFTPAEVNISSSLLSSSSSHHVRRAMAAGINPPEIEHTSVHPQAARG